MAGRGPAPKLPDERRNTSAPQRGEWIDVKPLEEPVLPLLPERTKAEGKWSPRTRRAWIAWRSDPVTALYGPGEIQAAIDLAFVYEEWVRGKSSLYSEIRQAQDRLGLNPKGKRDLRWRLVQADDAPAAAPKRTKSSSGRRARLTVVK